MSSPRAIFTLAVEGFLSIAAEITAADLEKPGLGVWSVRDLLGHTARALNTVTAYAAIPALDVQLHSETEYFQHMLGGPDQKALHGAVAERGRETGAQLGDHPLTVIQQWADEALRVVETSPPDATVTTPAGGMTLDCYLGLRTFELTVHGVDLCRALSLQVPAAFDEPLQDAARVTIALAQTQEQLADVLVALLGRSSWHTSLL